MIRRGEKRSRATHKRNTAETRKIFRVDVLGGEDGGAQEKDRGGGTRRWREKKERRGVRAGNS